MQGKLYGVGVGPGDPELMTLKALKRIQACPVIAVATRKREDSVAYRIAAGVVNFADKEFLELEMPMTRDEKRLAQSHAAAAQRIGDVLASGRDVAFLILGDPTVYATYGYVHRRVAALGYPTEMISGVPSFCAAAAALNISLVEKSQKLHVIPAGYAPDTAKDLSGTRVYMKAGRGIGRLKRALLQSDADVYMVENCGMDNEKCYLSADAMCENAGYYSIVIAKERDRADE